MSDRQADAISGVALLDEPMRLALYRYVVGQADAVGRDEAAKAARTTRENAAFHLDRLVEGGLLEPTFRRLSGRTGPGAGRPSKLYRRSSLELDVTVPARRYQLLAELLATAIDAARGADPRREVTRAARALGRGLGAEARGRAGSRPSRAALLRAAIAVLDEYGFAPAEESRGSVRLRNCPFDALARAHRQLVCGMNLAFMEGIIAGLDATGITARLDPQPGRCCVTLSTDR
jgi:predicted ArsR family transcriptional regulator